MKIRNKKTGGLANIDGDQDFIRVYTDAGWADYDSLAELNADWEDYKPAEPLIKDEKIRKAVRAWAEANEMPEVLYDKYEDCIHSTYGSDDTDTSVSISFDDCYVFEKLEHRKRYTIAELCGEEEDEIKS